MLKLSVVMATYNRAEILPETLRHLADQSLSSDEYEVLLVDDGSPDDTREVVEREAARMPFALRYFHHENRGPGYTENRGVREARAPLLLLMADDIFMSREALATHVDAHERQPEPEVAVLGRVDQSPALDQSTFLKTWDPFRFSDLEGRTELPYYLFWACNVSLKRDFMLEHGMFRERRGRAGAAAHEDVELGYRLHANGGLRLRYAEGALAHHYHVETLEGSMKRAYQRGLNWDEFRALVPTPEITVRYHVINRGTLGDHVRALTGPGRETLPPEDRNPFVLGARYLLRAVVFNAATLKVVWLPLLGLAERDTALGRFAAGLVNRNFYRGVINHHFLRGCRDGQKVYGRVDVERTA